MVEVGSVEALLVALHCGHTAWVHPDHTVGALVTCTACPKYTFPETGAETWETAWSVAVVALDRTEVAATIEFAE